VRAKLADKADMVCFKMIFICFLISISTFSALSAETYMSDEEYLQVIRQNLYTLRQSEVDDGLNFTDMNKNILDSLLSYQPGMSNGRAPGITYQQGRLLISKLMQQSDSEGFSQKYDPESNIGFCFGRALRIHLELLRYGVNKDSIKKIFVIGPMKSPGKIWQFHVATVVKDLKSNQWWVLDTNLGVPVSVEDWMKHYERTRTDEIKHWFRSNTIDRTKSLRFYITRAEKIGPSAWEYNIKTGGLFDGFYNGYFKDMFQYFKKNPVSEQEKFNSNKCSKLFSE
jgi:hypothetical protein